MCILACAETYKLYEKKQDIIKNYSSGRQVIHCVIIIASAPIGSEPVLEDFQSAKENLDLTSANGERNPGDKDKN